MTAPALGLLFIHHENHQVAHICVETSMHMSYPGHENTVILSHGCDNFKQVEYAIELLHKELDQIKAEARRKFGSPEMSNCGGNQFTRGQEINHHSTRNFIRWPRR